jgi:hypothetical protein
LISHQSTIAHTYTLISHTHPQNTHTTKPKPSPDAHDDARLLALLCIQNVVRRHWRGGPGGALLTRGGSSGLMGMRRHLREAAEMGEAEEAGDPQRALFLRQLRREYVVGEEEKSRLRAFLLGRMDEPNNVVGFLLWRWRFCFRGGLFRFLSLSLSCCVWLAFCFFGGGGRARCIHSIITDQINHPTLQFIIIHPKIQKQIQINRWPKTSRTCWPKSCGPTGPAGTG